MRFRVALLRQQSRGAGAARARRNQHHRHAPGQSRFLLHQ
jgi:hypothetical protein